MQSTESSDDQDNSNKKQLLVESETYTENTSNPKTEELATFIQSDADDKGRANCQSGCCCKNYCKVFRNTKLAVLLRYAVTYLLMVTVVNNNVFTLTVYTYVASTRISTRMFTLLQ